MHPVIATVDTGANAAFPDLRGVVVPAWNLVDNDRDTSDTAGHGTDIALVAAANANNGYGIAGACPMCRVMPVKVSLDGTTKPGSIAAGIRWAVDHGARIIVVSIVHTGVPDTSEQAAVAYAGAHGAVVIASAGNDGGTDPHYPAALSGVVSVGATDEHDRLYPWATHGPWVELAAPGCEYGAEMCGASYAPPLVAGAVGVLVAAAAGVTSQQAADALRATAVPVPGIAGGRIDVVAAAERLGILPRPTAAPPTAQLDLEQGTFVRSLRRRLTVAAARVSIVVTRVDAAPCTLTLRSAKGAYLSANGALTATVPHGTYELLIACGDARRRTYSVLVRAALG